MAKELPKEARFRVIVTQLHEEDLKGNKESLKGPRRVDMVFYRYDNDVTLNLLIDLEERTVESFERLTEAQPPLLLEEEAEALEIALKDRAVLRSLAQQQVDPETISANGFLFREQAPCLTHRCVMLFFNTGDQPLTIREDAFFPIVDLSAQRVDHIKTIEGNNRNNQSGH